LHRHKNKTRNFLLSPACHCKAFLRILALQVPAVESGVLRPPAHRGWWLVAGITTSKGGFPCWGCGLGVSKRQYNFTYPQGRCRAPPSRPAPPGAAVGQGVGGGPQGLSPDLAPPGPICEKVGSEALLPSLVKTQALTSCGRTRCCLWSAESPSYRSRILQLEVAD
jgi:hypothetical protein